MNQGKDFRCEISDGPVTSQCGLENNSRLILLVLTLLRIHMILQ